MHKESHSIEELFDIQLPKLLIYGNNPAFEKVFPKLQQRIGVKVVKTNTEKELLEEIHMDPQSILGLIAFSSDHLNLPESLTIQPLIFHTSDDIKEVLKKVYQYLSKSVPKNLVELHRNSIQYLFAKTFGCSLGSVDERIDFTPQFTHLVTCESIASNMEIKITCELDYEKFKSRSENLLSENETKICDRFGEFCNQFLGTINFRLKELGIDALICLPLTIQINPQTEISETKYTPPFIMTSHSKDLTVSIACDFDLSSEIEWNQLSTDPEFDDSEFFGPLN